MSADTLLVQLRDLLKEGQEAPLADWVTSMQDAIKDMCLPELDLFFSRCMRLCRDYVDSANANAIYDGMLRQLETKGKLIRYFYALFPGDENVGEYIHWFHNIMDRVNEPGCVSHCNVLLAKFGLSAVPDILLAAKHHQSSKLYNVVYNQLDSIWSCCNMPYFAVTKTEESLDGNMFKNLCFGYMREAFDDTEFTPKFLLESPIPNFDEKMDSDLQMLQENYSDEELDDRMNRYSARAVNIIGPDNIMRHILHEGVLSMDSYIFCKSMFEDMDDLCNRDDKYLLMCEKAYRATGKMPRYLANTYDTLEIKEEDKKKENGPTEDWINAPHDDEEKEDIKPKKKEKDEFDLEDSLKKDDKKFGAGGNTIYNISYHNSFNRNRKNMITDSYNKSRTNSDDISYGGGMDADDLNDRQYANKEHVLSAWNKRRKEQSKLQDTYSKKELSHPDNPPKEYLNAICWNKENLRKVDPWIIMKDTQKGRPSNDVGYRKYLAKQINDLAEEREIDFDGKIIVAGDPIDGLYDIEVSRYNDVAIIDALRKCANAVIQKELKKEKPSTNNKTVQEALEYFDMIDSMEEAILGSDPEKDRPFGQRVQNSIQGMNDKAQGAVNKVDNGLRTTSNIVRGAVQTPMQLVNTVKNFISEMKNRKEQNIKEQILHDKKLRLQCFDLMGSLIKTALPWAIAGPLWGTLFNLVALPVRGIKGGWQALRGGKYRDLKIEMREELRVEMDVMQQKINSEGDRNKKYQLMRQLNRMEREYMKIASQVHFDPVAEKRRRRGDSWYM